MFRFWFVSAITVAVLVGAATGDNQNDVITALLSRMDAIEERVSSLGDEIASLDDRLAEIDGKKTEPVPTEFRLLNVTQRHDGQTSTVDYSVLYESEEEVQVLMSHSEFAIPKELPHEAGAVHFSLPDSHPSPVLYVRTSSNLIYTLILIQATGPAPEEPEHIPNVVLTTSPEHSLTFQEHHEPELTVTSWLIGDRRVKKESLLYYAYILRDNVVDFADVSQMYAEKLDTSSASNDVIGDADARSGDGGNPPQRLRLVSHDREGGETNDELRLDTSYENSGVLYVEKRYELQCRACVLYEIRVTKPLPYYLDDGEYSLPEGAHVPYKDLYSFGPDFEGPRYLRFVRYNTSEGINTVTKSCRVGQPCRLYCEAYGDQPTAYLTLQANVMTTQPTYYDQSLAPVSENSGRAKVKGWSLKFGYVAFSVIEFDDVRANHAGVYYCYANVDSGLMLRRVYSLTVLQ